MKTRGKSKSKTRGKSKTRSKSKTVNIVNKCSNGLKYFIRETANNKETHIILMVRTGGVNEGTHSGIAHLLEHLLFTGTREFSTSQSLVEAIEKYGASVNAYTGHQVT